MKSHLYSAPKMEPASRRKCRGRADNRQLTRSLQGVQGRNGLYFAGQHTTGMDLQEAAVYSAMKVADQLAPQSASLASLRARLASNGQSGISYDL